MLKRVILSISLVSVVVLAFLLNFTNPSGVGPLGVLVAFLAFYAITLGVSVLFISIYRKMTGEKNKNEKRDFLYAAVIGFGPILLLLMKAFDIFNIVTIGIAILFVFLGCFLVKNRFNVVK